MSSSGDNDSISKRPTVSEPRVSLDDPSKALSTSLVHFHPGTTNMRERPQSVLSGVFFAGDPPLRRKVPRGDSVTINMSQRALLDETSQYNPSFPQDKDSDGRSSHHTVEVAVSPRDLDGSWRPLPPAGDLHRRHENETEAWSLNSLVRFNGRGSQPTQGRRPNGTITKVSIAILPSEFLDLSPLGSSPTFAGTSNLEKHTTHIVVATKACKNRPAIDKSVSHEATSSPLVGIFQRLLDGPKLTWQVSRCGQPQCGRNLYEESIRTTSIPDSEYDEPHHPFCESSRSTPDIIIRTSSAQEYRYPKNQKNRPDKMSKWSSKLCSFFTSHPMDPKNRVPFSAGRLTGQRELYETFVSS